MTWAMCFRLVVDVRIPPNTIARPREAFLALGSASNAGSLQAAWHSQSLQRRRPAVCVVCLSVVFFPHPPTLFYFISFRFNFYFFEHSFTSTSVEPEIALLAFYAVTGEISPHTSSMADTSRLLQSAAVPAEVREVSSSPVHF